LRDRVERVLTTAWQTKGALARALYPLTYLYRALHAADQAMAHPERLRVPVLVVGNLTVGGAGKTPLTIELARRLRTRGWHPGIVARGYGTENRQPRMVDLRLDGHRIAGGGRRQPHRRRKAAAQPAPRP
jgi:tetraacyldisaccharide 4'-kinase